MSKASVVFLQCLAGNALKVPNSDCSAPLHTTYVPRLDVGYLGLMIEDGK